MESEPEIRRWHQGPEREKLKGEEYPMLSRIAVVCPASGCGLAFVELNALGVHVSQKHGMKFKIPSCAVKSDQSRLKRMQSYRGRKVSEGLRRYHRKRRMTALPQEDFFPLLAQADQLLATIKTQPPQQQIPPFQRLHYRLHPPPLFPQTLDLSDQQEQDDNGYQMPPRCRLLNPNSSQYQSHPLQQASYETGRQHELNQICQPAPIFTHPVLPSFPSAFQQVGVEDGGLEMASPWYQMPATTPNPWMTPADTVEADHRTYRVL